MASSQQGQIGIQTQSLFGFQKDVVQRGVLLGGDLEHQTEGDKLGFPELYQDELNPGAEVEEAVD